VAESSNAQRFNEQYAGVTMEWVDSFQLTDKATLVQYGLDESMLVDTLVQCSLRQILGELAYTYSTTCYVL
jgi:hypothetical protein